MLLEHGKKKGVFGGFTDNYIRVEVSAPTPLPKRGENFFQDNEIVNVRLTGWNEKGDALMGELNILLP